MRRRDPGTRFVVFTISKYLIFLVGYGAAILTLQFSFASLGWLIAAASVGLGFGLQEIVSNFFSGLILFFERPVRVGDVVTVGTTTGTVQGISIRATQVLDFDRRVIMIPNRRFIVEDVVNWSHNDLVVRRRIQVGVAYGTDVKRVADILLEVARDCPHVKPDPAPSVVFTTFGASSLDMDLLVFVEIEHRMTVLSDLNMAISRRFAEEGIQIPFPQRDLHLRSVQDAAVLRALGPESAASDAAEEEET
jgi:potassium efflux system protein